MPNCKIVDTLHSPPFGQAMYISIRFVYYLEIYSVDNTSCFFTDSSVFTVSTKLKVGGLVTSFNPLVEPVTPGCNKKGRG